jgi:hypothetical protein
VDLGMTDEKILLWVAVSLLVITFLVGVFTTAAVVLKNF